MKHKLIVAIVVIIAACVAVHFYVQWEKARFDASLPKPPAEEEQVADDVTEDTAGGHWHGDEWHAEPHPAPKPAKPPRPFEVFVTAEEMPRTSTGKETAKPKRPDIWADHDLDFPPEGAPRPLKHLNALELYNFSLAPDLTDEELIQVQSEFFFRYVTKEKREDLRRGRAYAREQRAALKAFREKYPARDSAD